MTIKNLFRIIIAGIIALLGGIVGLQKNKLAKQSTRIDTYAQKLEHVEKEKELYVSENEGAKKQDIIQESVNNNIIEESVKIKEAKNNEEVIDTSNNIIDNWNSK